MMLHLKALGFQLVALLVGLLACMGAVGMGWWLDLREGAMFAWGLLVAVPAGLAPWLMAEAITIRWYREAR